MNVKPSPPDLSHPDRAPTDQEIAEAVGARMMAQDQASALLGIRLDEIGPGHARASMLVRPDMVNGHDICHGGMIFTLADTAFACACNTANQVAVAQGAQISFLAAARAGDLLSAAAVKRSATGRTGVYDVTVTDQEGRTIALFRGNSYRIKGEVVPDLKVTP